MNSIAKTILVTIIASTMMSALAFGRGNSHGNAIISARLKVVKVDLGSQDNLTDMNGIDVVAKGLKNHRLIGIGEFSHGSLQSQIVRVKLVKELITVHGFRLFFLEEPLARARRIDAFVCGANNSCSARDVMLAGNWSWIWSTKEMAELFDWMRNFNLGRSGNDLIHVVGVDNQYTDEQIFELKRLLAKVECSDELKATIEQAYNNMPKLGLAYGNADATAQVCRDPARPARRILAHALMAKAKAMSLTEKGLDSSVLSLLQSAFLGTMFAVTQDYNVRELAMADAIRTSLEATMGSRGVFWAHNVHVSSGYVSDGYCGIRLKEWLGDEYYALGMFAGHGEINAKNVYDDDAYDAEVRMPDKKIPELIPIKRMYYSMPNWFWEGVLSKAGKSYFADGKTVMRDETVGILLHERLYNFGMAGADYYQEKGKPPPAEVVISAPATAYDGWIFIERTTPSAIFGRH